MIRAFRYFARGRRYGNSAIGSWFVRLLVGILVVTGCRGQAGNTSKKLQSELVLAAAPVLQGVLEKLIAEYTAQHPTVNVQVRYGPSGVLVNQIKEGAPCDVFMAADMDSCTALINEGIAKGPVVVYGQGRLCLAGKGLMPLAAYMEKNVEAEKQLASMFERVLEFPGINSLSIANPEVSPYGKLSVALMRQMGMGFSGDTLRSSSGRNIKLITAGSLAQVRQYVLEGIVDAGFVSYSIIKTSSGFFNPSAQSSASEGIPWMMVPPELSPPVNQGLVVLSDREEAHRWKKFLASSRAREILEEGGYIVP
ncbi:MAG TPA: molybdate ABC transporter substrate-binding protein [Termitinemataceae bacterium]|nr:molybdate ABC transporter substrate-binding protein [Termitinemataceae bacterium]HPP99811.1 molybdate ABC transporter substrate-binding protein [Termitinemataceae bacterium]